MLTELRCCGSLIESFLASRDDIVAPDNLRILSASQPIVSSLGIIWVLKPFNPGPLTSLAHIFASAMSVAIAICVSGAASTIRSSKGQTCSSGRYFGRKKCRIPTRSPPEPGWHETRNSLACPCGTVSAGLAPAPRCIVSSCLKWGVPEMVVRAGNTCLCWV